MGSSDVITLVIRSEVQKALTDMQKVNAGLGNMEKSAKTSGQAFDDMKASFAKVMAIGAGLAVLAAGFNKVVNAASDLNEAQNYFSETFKNSMGTATKIVEELATSYAMSHREAYQLTAEIGSFAKAMGYASADAAELAGSVVKLAADLGSFKNVKTEDALLAIRSALSGEAEPMKRFGVNVNETAIQMEALRMKIWDGKGALDAKTKSMAAYSIIMKSTKDAQGDMIRTQDSWANQVKRAKANAEEFAASIGSKMLPVLNTFLRDLNKSSGIEIGSAIGELIAKILIGFKMLKAGWDALLASIDYGVQKIAQGFTYIVWKANEALGNTQMAAGLKKEYDIAANAAQAALNKISGAQASFAESQKLWIEAGKNAVVKSYKDNLNAHSDAIKQEKVMTQKEIDEAEKKRQELINKITSSIGSLIGSVSSIMNNVFAIMKNSMQAQAMIWDQRSKFMDMMFVAEKDKLDAKFQEDSDRINAEYERDKLAIQNSVMSQEEKNNALNRLDEQYNTKKQVLDNQKQVAEEKAAKKEKDLKTLMDAFNMQMKHRAAKREQEMSFTQAIINAFSASGQVFASCMSLPYPANLIAGGISAAAALATGLALAMSIKAQPIPYLASGGLVQASMAGTPIIAGEGGRSEAILPIDDPRAMDKIRGGMGGGLTVIIENLYGESDIPTKVAQAFDKAFVKLKQDGRLKLASVL